MSRAPLLKPLPAPIEVAHATRAAIGRAGPTLWILACGSTTLLFFARQFSLSMIPWSAEHGLAGKLLFGALLVVRPAIPNLGGAAMLWCVDEVEAGGAPPSWSAAVAALLPRAIPILVVSEAVSVLVQVGLGLYVLPGVLALLETFACVPFVVTRDAGVFEAFAWTQKLLQGVRLPLLRILLLIDVFYLVAGFGVFSPIDALIGALRWLGPVRFTAPVVFAVRLAVLSPLMVWMVAGTQVVFRAMLDARGLLDVEEVG